MELQHTREQQFGKHDSKVGKILSESTQRSVITLALAMLVSAMILDPPMFLAQPYGYSLGLKVLTNVYGDEEAYDQALKAYLDSFKDDPAKLLLVIVNENVWKEPGSVNVNELRSIEKQVSYYVNPDGDVTSVAVHDVSEFTQL